MLPLRFLLMAQVVLALQLPFVLVPLIKATSSKQLMGPHRNSRLLAGAAWASCGLVFSANLGLFVSELWPGAELVPLVDTQGGCVAGWWWWEGMEVAV
jgi:Mn2+/Fe2+ NRAMP family transporter